MCKGLLGKKLGMTSIFTQEGEMQPVTVLELGPCVVTQVKTESVDGYTALQLGFGEKKASRVNKAIGGHLKKGGVNSRFLKEFDVEKPEDFSPGQVLYSSDIFMIGEKVDISGTMKGRGFSGVIKRHGFAGGRKTHGSKCHRIPGSIGCSAWPAKVVKGKKLPGHYGNTRKTVKNLQIVDIRPEDNLIFIKGAVPGAKDSLVEVRKLKTAK
jgi:large subunit ribosomal protein L3